MNQFRVTAIVLCASLGDTLALAAPADGQAIFEQSCAMCHQRGATGLSGMYPRLAGRAARIATRPEGRRYLISVLSHGLTGSIVVDGGTYNGVMPPAFALSDEQMAAVLNYVMGLSGGSGSGASLFTAQEVQAVRRGEALSANDVHAMRNSAVRRSDDQKPH